MTIAIYCISAMALLIFALGLWVSVQRGRTNVITGIETDPTSGLNKAVRAHANAAEYVPTLGVLMLYLGTQPMAAWVGWVMIIAAASRYLTAIGFLACATLEKPHILKAIGALGTYAGGIALCVAAVLTLG